jgi:hypothetical protein
LRGYFPGSRAEPHGSPYGAACRGPKPPRKAGRIGGAA